MVPEKRVEHPNFLPFAWTEDHSKPNCLLLLPLLSPGQQAGRLGSLPAVSYPHMTVLFGALVFTAGTHREFATQWKLVGLADFIGTFDQNFF